MDPLTRDATGELGFTNLRSWAWWHLRELLDPENPESKDVRIPPDDTLTGDLTTPKWRVTSAMKIEVEPKNVPSTAAMRQNEDGPGWWGNSSIAKRLGRSTDRGDAVIMAYASRLLGVSLEVPGSHREDGDGADWMRTGYIPDDELAE